MADNFVLGIDVSAYQASADGARRFDWGKAAARIYFAFIRASVGAAGVDFQLYYNLQECRRLGIPFGLYHFLKPEKDWKKQADLFAGLAINGKTGQPAGVLPPALDVEDDGDLSKAALGSYVEKFVMRFEAATGLKLMIYTSPGFWNGSMPLTNWAKNRELWVANYKVTLPQLPREWGECNNPRTWKFWQYSCTGDGPAYGSNGDDDIDLNYYNGSLADFNQEYHTSLAPLPENPEQPAPAVPEWVKVKVNRLNLRNKPEISAATDAGDLHQGARLRVLEDCGLWWRVEGYTWKRGVEGEVRRLEPLKDMR